MKRIMMLATGGTIASAPTETGLAPARTAAELLERVPEIGQLAEIRCQDVFSLDSSNIQPEEWCTLAQAIYEALLHSDGVVVTHGTDTMAYTASAVSFMLRGVHAPVVFTGSQLPISAPHTDARENLVSAVMCACTATQGSYVVFRNKVINGTRAVKTHSMGFDAFDSINAPLAGVVDAYGVHMHHEVHQTGQFRLRNQVDPRVFLLRLIPGTAPELFRYIAQAGYRGVVIEAFGLGGLHFLRRNLVDALAMLADSGLVVLVTTQCLYDKTDFSLYEVGRRLPAGRIFSGQDMTTEAAVTKLMWALGQSREIEQVGALLRSNLHGEIQG